MGSPVSVMHCMMWQNPWRRIPELTTAHRFRRWKMPKTPSKLCMLGRPRLLLARSMDSSVLTIFGRENYGLTLLDVRGPGSILLYNRSWQIIRPCNLRCAYPGRTNSSRYLPRRSYSVNGYVNRQNAERFHWTHEQFISVSCMFRACWRQCHLWRWERNGLGMGPPCCRFTFTSAAHFFLISRRPNPLTPILLRKLIQKWSPGQSTIHLTQMKW